MQKSRIGLAAAVVTLAAVVSGDQAAAPAETSLRGEVVDLHCYVTRGARGPEHAGCANACLGRGVTPAFVAEDGRLFLLLAERPVSVKDAVAGLAGETVVARGVVHERDGVRALQLKAVEKLGR